MRPPNLETRNLNTLDQRNLEDILYHGATDGFPPALLDKFTPEEVVLLLDHPQWKLFTEDFVALIWDSVGYLFEERMKNIA